MTAPIHQDDRALADLFGVHYFQADASVTHVSTDDDMYAYTAYQGKHAFAVERGDCVFLKDGDTARLIRGEKQQVESDEFAVVIRGYAPPEKTASLKSRMLLPYVNGCSTRQVFPPERIGDPTLQLLNIPPYSSEQAHHIHSTVRVVHVLSGRGYSVVGMRDATIKTTLTPGMMCILDNMCPHHFETEGSNLLVMPVHVWSTAPGGLENVHPMFNGTFLMNQGG